METNSHTIISRVFERSAHPNSLVRSIAEWIGCAIIEGRLLPGDDLNSHDLSKQFRTSRTPVREALILLEKEGLVEIPARRRPRVAYLSLNEVRAIYQVRASLYALVAELIVMTASTEEILLLQPYLNLMEEFAAKDDLNAYFWANVAFRDTESTLCGNDEVKRILDLLMLRTLKLRRFTSSLPGHMQQEVADHKRILRAYKERDAPLAIALKRSLVFGGLAAIEQSGWTGAKMQDRNRTYQEKEIGQEPHNFSQGLEKRLAQHENCHP